MAATGTRKWAGIAIICTAVALLNGGAARADDGKALEELVKRLDRLEKQNDELRGKLQELGKTAPPSAVGKDDKAKDDPDKKEKDKVGKLVEDHLKDKEKKDREKKEQEAKQKEAEGFEVGKQLDFKARWNHGPWLETEDKAFRIHLTGRAQMDAVFVHAPKEMMVSTGRQGIGEYDDALNFRRARLGVEGTFWEVFDFYTEYDFFNTIRIVPGGARLDLDEGRIAGTEGTSADRGAVINTPVPTDFWVNWKGLPVVGNVRIGSHKPLVAMEHMTSSKYLNFMERSLAFDAFVELGDNGFMPGVSLWRTLLDQHLFVGAGVFRPNIRNIFGWNVGDGEWLATARVAGTPYYRDHGRYLVHLGVGALHSTADDNVIRFRARPLVRNGPAVLHNTIAQIQGDLHNYSLVVPEFLAIWGPFSVAAEWYGAFVHQRPTGEFARVGTQGHVVEGGRGSLFYHGGYVEVGYFLTGESRNYSRTFMCLDRQLVHETAFAVENEEGGHCCGRGAWQLLARFDYLDLDNKGGNGGVINNLTLGVNWYLNPNSKLQFNYVLAHRNATEYHDEVVAANGLDSRDGWIQGFGTRFALDF